MKYFYLALLSLITVFSLQGQLCEGNLGENIFTDGDFGSGAANILTPNPQIAPGYGYVTNPPPNDGNYCITNSTAIWGGFAAFWMDISDNSDDPNGYMMVVNASFFPGTFYEQEVNGLCDNTLYVFSADVFNLLPQGGIKPNVSFLIDGAIIFQSGDVPTNQQWNTYGFTFTTNPGQTSVTLALQNNAPGGEGNDLALDNITFRACGPEALILPEEVANICEDGNPIDLNATINGTQYSNPTIQWQQSFDEGLTWENIAGATNLSYPFTNLTGGLYYYRYLLADGEANLSNPFCRVISNVKTIHVIPKFYTIVDSLCMGLSFSLADNFYDETGIYTDSLITYLGCDSIVTLDLTIIPDTEIGATFSLIETGCVGEESGSISVDTIVNSISPYLILVNEEPVGENIFGLSGGDYFYQISDQYGCTFDTTISLRTPEPYLVDIGENLSVDLGNTVSVDAVFSESTENYRWQIVGEIICDSDCETLEFTPENSLTLTLIANSLAADCLATDSIQITVTDIRKIYIPNAFSPNDDGVNDFFTIQGVLPNVQQVNRFAVYSRWGELIYEAESFLPNDTNFAWDGSFRGQIVADGVYLYTAEVLFLNGETSFYKGDVSVLK